MVIRSYRVSEKVGPTKNDSPDLNVPLDENKSSISQFLKPVDKKTEINKVIEPATSNTVKPETNNVKSEPSAVKSEPKEVGFTRVRWRFQILRPYNRLFTRVRKGKGARMARMSNQKHQR